ncbi:Retrovirus-related Pol polyprotein from type-1 retrotransposable element R2 [Chionoecetes opilio]|uniref:Retrovirus-related Pol polyprotein from type-1 retrotransposable element R2 n=1 Tax=Chionoecetes opilio TaxID=41210 RepID=A0A8J4YFE4_CHIOP|nr:Retrovirus-related Pol polyprotein from type-1 retrotransposable element R2 [Chionoecetes opilio]
MASKQKGSDKRKRVNLSTAEKLELIKKVESGVCVEYGVKKQTVSDIRKAKDKLREYAVKFNVDARSALEDLSLDEPLNIAASLDRELEVEGNPLNKSISSRFANSGLLGSSAPVNIPGSSFQERSGGLITNPSPSTSSPAFTHSFFQSSIHRENSLDQASAIRAADEHLVSDMDGQMARWAEYFGQLFTVDPPIEQLHTTGLQACFVSWWNTDVSFDGMLAPYVDLKKAFDSVHRESLWDLLRLRGIPARTIGLMTGLYSGTESAVKCRGGVSSFFPVNTGVRQGCILAPSLFNTCMNWVLDKVVDQSDCGSSLGNTKITDLVFADDAVIFAESLEVLVIALEALHEEATPLGLEVSWLKTKVQVFGGLLDETVQSVHASGEDIEILESFTYLGSAVHNDGGSRQEVLLRIGIAHGVMDSLSGSIRGCLYLCRRTKIRIFKSLVIPILLYGCETWTLNSDLKRRIDAFGMGHGMCLWYWVWCAQGGTHKARGWGKLMFLVKSCLVGKGACVGNRTW